MNRIRLVQNRFLWGVGILALAGGALIIYSTLKGLSGGSDPVGYLVSARNFVRGLGVGYAYPDGRFHRLDIHPPLYVISIGVVAFFHINVLRAALILDMVYFAAVILILGILFHRFSTNSSFSLLASLTVAVFPAFLGIYFSAMTESLYFPLFLGSIFCLLVYLKNHRNRWWILSAALIGLAIITRYDGIAVIPVGLISLLLFDQGTVGARFKKAFLFGVLAILPLLILGISLHFNVGQPALQRGLSVEWSMLSNQFQQFRSATLDVLWKWIPFQSSLPILKSRSRLLFLGLILISVIGITLLAAGRNKRVLSLKQDGDFQIFIIFILVLVFTFAFLIFTSLVFGLPARMDDRQLLPVYISAVLSLLSGFACWQKAWFRKAGWMQVLAWMVAGVFIYWHFPGAVATIQNARSGSGSLAYAWQNSELLKAVQALPANTPLVSNRSDVLLLWADRPAYDFVAGLQPGFIEDDQALYGSDPSDSGQVAFREKSAALVIFGSNMPQELENVFLEPGRLRAKTIFDGLVISEKVPDGTIYFYPK